MTIKSPSLIITQPPDYDIWEKPRRKDMSFKGADKKM